MNIIFASRIMRKSLPMFVFLLFHLLLNVNAQSYNQNFIQEKIALDSLFHDYINNLIYYDGLGNDIEHISNSSEIGKYIYTYFTLDTKGRTELNYLPIAIPSTSCYIDENKFKSLSTTFYNGDNSAFIKNVYNVDNDIVFEELSGQDWKKNNKGNIREFSANSALDKVLHYDAPIDKISLVKPENTSYRYFPPGSLVKEIYEDADNKSIIIFKDLQDNVVLERRDVGDTYFVYNILGQLRYVLTPRYQESGYKDKYAYEYRYDSRGRTVKKFIPGCGYTQYWYDNENHLTFMQDEILREKDFYRFYLYDSYERLAIQGICANSNRDIKYIRPYVYYLGYDKGLYNTYYVWKNIDRLNFDCVEIEKVYYYDTYKFIESFPQDVFSLESQNDKATKGRLLGTKILASNGQYLYNVYRYDGKGNLIETITKGIDGYSSQISNEYSFTDKIKTSLACVNVRYGKDFLAKLDNEYNSNNNMINKTTISASHNGKVSKVAIEYEYDDFNRLAKINRPFSNGKLEFSYDMHGWINSIDSKSFKERLYYTDGVGSPYYNGNISSVLWCNSSYPQIRGYKFTYDKLNRLCNAEYGEMTDLSDKQNRYNEYLEYDSNGNITRLQRRGKKQNGEYGKIDNLNIRYNGNQIDFVEDDADKLIYKGAFDFNVSDNGRAEYKYNSSGALVCDTGRGISMIEYDNNGNPIRIQFSNGSVTNYVYNIDGEKLRCIHYTAMPNIVVSVGDIYELSEEDIIHVDSIDYLLGGNLILENGKIDKYLFNGGYFLLDKAKSPHIDIPPYPQGENGNPPSEEQLKEYEKKLEQWRTNVDFALDVLTPFYYTKDHLGNNREVLNETGDIVQVNNYYPFGSPYCDNVSMLRTGLQPYKFCGKELDTTHGLNTYDYGARQFFSPLPVWSKPDKLCEKYYHVSPYAFCLNNPNIVYDEDGNIVKILYDSNNSTYSYRFDGVFDKSSSAPRNQFVRDVIAAYLYLRSKNASEMFDKMISSDKVVYIHQTKGVSYPEYNFRTDLFWDPYSGLDLGKGRTQSPATQLEHEFTHIVDYYSNIQEHKIRSSTIDLQYDTKEERRVITGHEKEIVNKLGESVRYNHEGILFKTNGPTSRSRYTPNQKPFSQRIEERINDYFINKTDKTKVGVIW